MYNVLNRPSWFVNPNIEVFRQPFEWVTDNTRKFMSMGYLDKGVSAEQRSYQICDGFYKNQQKMGINEPVARRKASELVIGIEQGWVSFSTPAWVSYGLPKGLAIACFGSTIGHESMEDIMYTASEIAMLTKYGGGTSVNLSHIRSRGTPISVGGKADGSAHFSGLYNAVMQISRQGEARRGYCAAYLEADHGDVMEFLDIGRDNSEIQNITTGISFSDDFLTKAYNGSEHEKEVIAKVGKVRSEIGYPYVFFKDNANRARPQVYKDLDKEIEMSNLCTEIMLPNSLDETFVCVLSSLNLVHYDEWKNTSLVRTMITFLDTVVEESIEKLQYLYDRREQELAEMFPDAENNAPKLFLQRIEKFLKRHRALGLGTMGLHHLYQSKMLPFESPQAARLNNEIFKHIRSEAEAETAYLAETIGEPELLKGYGRRNTTLLAIAPTKSSASIMGYVSESIQPELSNYYLADLAKDVVVVKNPYLKRLLAEKGKDTPDVWDKILATDSVQDLEFLSQLEKDVFKTFAEISPRSIIDQAATRGEHIDQGQPLNLIFHPDVSADEINGWMFYAWKMGIKSLYYQKGISPAQINNMKILNSNRDCLSCSA